MEDAALSDRWASAVVYSQSVAEELLVEFQGRFAIVGTRVCGVVLIGAIAKPLCNNNDDNSERKSAAYIP